MRRLLAAHEGSVLIARVREHAGSFGTNYFLPESSFDRGPWFAVEGEEAVILLLREERFDRVYFAAANSEALAALLPQVPLPPSGSLVTDVIQKSGTDGTAAQNPWADVATASGFAPYAEFQRMFRLGAPDLQAPATLPSVERLGPQDTEAVQSALAAQFDCYAEHIPKAAETAAAIALGSVYGVRVGRQLAAILYFDRTGLTTMLRYWLVLTPFRGQKLGIALMQQYFLDCATCRRFLLWVETRNQRAIDLYRGYGYAQDSTMDMILLKR